jgi:pheromone shutdown-related protein TraB
MREDKVNNSRNYTEDVQIVNKDGREFIIVGTAHISRQSANLVKEVIETERPDTVCVELDEKRYKSLSEKKRWESLDLKTIIREKQLSTLIMNLVLASYQKKLGEKLGVEPGSELLQATQTATELDLPIELCDREVRITLRRAWHSMSFWQKLKFLTSGLAGLFEKQELNEEKLAELRSKDVLSEMMEELGKAMPVLKRVLIDERDTYLAEKTKLASGNKIVTVVGAGHVNGIIKHLKDDREVNLSDIEKIPQSKHIVKIIGWGIPIIIVASILFIGYSKGLAAPFTSLTPVIGAGYVAAFVQAYYQPPVVKEIQNVISDFGNLANWWKNKLLRVFLVFILTSLGSVIGTYVGFFEIISNVFN